MAKELPYFKFVISEYLNGDIYLEDYRTQGVFINICAYYWHCSCDLTLSKLKKKYKDIDPEVFILSTEKIIKIKGEKITINFLDEQWNSKQVLKVINRNNGAKGGRPIKPIESEYKPKNNPMGLISESETKANVNPNITNIDKIIVDKIIVDDNIPSTSANFFTVKNFSDEITIGINEFSRYAISQTKKTEDELNKFRIEFLTAQKALSNFSWANASDAKKHFISWVNKQPKPQSMTASRRVDN